MYSIQYSSKNSQYYYGTQNDFQDYYLQNSYIYNSNTYNQTQSQNSSKYFQIARGNNQSIVPRSSNESSQQTSPTWVSQYNFPNHHPYKSNPSASHVVGSQNLNYNHYSYYQNPVQNQVDSRTDNIQVIVSSQVFIPYHSTSIYSTGNSSIYQSQCAISDPFYAHPRTYTQSIPSVYTSTISAVSKYPSLINEQKSQGILQLNPSNLVSNQIYDDKQDSPIVKLGRVAVIHPPPGILPVANSNLNEKNSPELSSIQSLPRTKSDDEIGDLINFDPLPTESPPRTKIEVEFSDLNECFENLFGSDSENTNFQVQRNLNPVTLTQAKSVLKSDKIPNNESKGKRKRRSESNQNVKSEIPSLLSLKIPNPSRLSMPGWDGIMSHEERKYRLDRGFPLLWPPKPLTESLSKEFCTQSVQENCPIWSKLSYKKEPMRASANLERGKTAPKSPPNRPTYNKSKAVANHHFANDFDQPTCSQFALHANCPRFSRRSADRLSSNRTTSLANHHLANDSHPPTCPCCAQFALHALQHQFSSCISGLLSPWPPHFSCWCIRRRCCCCVQVPCAPICHLPIRPEGRSTPRLRGRSLIGGGGCTTGRTDHYI